MDEEIWIINKTDKKITVDVKEVYFYYGDTALPNENAERNILYTYCDKCGAGRFFRKVGEDMWKCETCGTEKTTTELIEKMRSILDTD